jgi:WD40 repeat protein
LWNAADPARVTPVATLPGQGGDVAALSFSPDGHLLASASDNGTAVLWNIADPAHPAHTATLHAAVPSPAPVSFCPNAALAFSADGHTLTTVEDSTTVTQWNVTGPGAVTRLITSILSSTGDGPVAFSADGRTLAGAHTTGDTIALSVLP